MCFLRLVSYRSQDDLKINENEKIISYREKHTYRHRIQWHFIFYQWEIKLLSLTYQMDNVPVRRFCQVFCC